MGKRQAPKGTTGKDKCSKCGRSYYQLADKKTIECPSCNPGLYKSQKEKEGRKYVQTRSKK